MFSVKFNRLLVLYIPIRFTSHDHTLGNKTFSPATANRRQPHAFPLPTLQCAKLHCHAGDGRLASTVRVMGWACGMYGGEDKLIQSFGG